MGSLLSVCWSPGPGFIIVMVDWCQCKTQGVNARQREGVLLDGADCDAMMTATAKWKRHEEIASIREL